MKKTLIAFVLLVSGSVMAQTNYKTCMNPCKQRRDSIKREINLHIQKAMVYNTFGHALTIGFFASAILGYYTTTQSNGNDNTGLKTIFIPLSFGVGALSFKVLGGRQEKKARILK